MTFDHDEGLDAREASLYDQDNDHEFWPHRSELTRSQRVAAWGLLWWSITVFAVSLVWWAVK